MKIIAILAVADGTTGVREETIPDLSFNSVKSLFPGHNWCRLDTITQKSAHGKRVVRVELAQKEPFTYMTHLLIEV